MAADKKKDGGSEDRSADDIKKEIDAETDKGASKGTDEPKVEWKDDSKDDKGEPKEGKAKKAGKAIGAGAARVGGYALGKLKDSGGADSDSTIGMKWWIITLVIGAFLWYFLGWFFALYVMIGILVLKWAHKKHNKAYKIIMFFLIAGFLTFVVLSFAGTGQVIRIQSKYFGEGDRLSMNTLAMSELEYFWKCKIMSVRGCQVAKLAGDTGGIYVTALGSSLPVYDEMSEAGGAGTPIQVRGETLGKTWTANDTRGEGPDIATTKLEVTAKWMDDVLREDNPDGWKCYPSKIRANQDFYCNHDPVEISKFAGQDEKICGASFKRIKPDIDSEIFCGVRTTATYEYKTIGKRFFKFTDSFDTNLFDDVSEKDMWWSVKAPVQLSIGTNLLWNAPIHPLKPDPEEPEEIPFIQVNVQVNNNIPSGFKALSKGLDINAMSASLSTLELSMDSVEGIRIMCGKGGTIPARQEENAVICEHDFGGKKIVGDDTTNYAFYIYFDDYTPSAVDDYEIRGDIAYTSEISRDTTAVIWFKVPKSSGGGGGGGGGIG